MAVTEHIVQSIRVATGKTLRVEINYRHIQIRRQITIHVGRYMENDELISNHFKKKYINAYTLQNS